MEIKSEVFGSCVEEIDVSINFIRGVQARRPPVPGKMTPFGGV
jgi:hypothetical protein